MHSYDRTTRMNGPTALFPFENNDVELTKNPVEGFSAGLVDDSNIYEWEVMIIGPPDTLYEGGFFKTILSFPKDYPQVSAINK